MLLADCPFVQGSLEYSLEAVAVPQNLLEAAAPAAYLPEQPADQKQALPAVTFAGPLVGPVADLHY